ncbi:MAG: Eco57I restriction-modification methylase domain-containing protein [Candidatus Heimdallarchaeota archaeon]
MPEQLIEVKKKLGAYNTPPSVAQFLLLYSLQLQIKAIVQHGKEAARKKDVLNFSQAIEDLSHVKVLDPACGDGTFLIEALKMIERGYETLRAFYLKENLHTDDLEEKAGKIMEGPFAQRIGLENLYGVDIDASAIESALERLTTYMATRNSENGLSEKSFHSIRIKDALKLNFKVGNALKIPSSDWLSKSKDYKDWIQEMALWRNQIREQAFLHPNAGESSLITSSLKREADNLSSNISKKLETASEILAPRKPEGNFENQNELFIWELNFPEVFLRKNPGFDVICGNPPYINLEMIRDSDLNHFLRTSDRWQHLYRGKGDVQYHFLILSIQLLRRKGHLAMVTSRYWPENKNADILRRQLKSQTRLIKLLDLSENALFNAGIHVLLVILEKSQPDYDYNFEFARIDNLDQPILEMFTREMEIRWAKILAREVFSRNGAPWRLFAADIAELIKRMEGILQSPEPTGFRLDEVAYIGEGIKTGNDVVFASFEHLGSGYYRNRFDKSRHKYRFEAQLMRPVITFSKEIFPFYAVPSKSFLLCAHKIGASAGRYPIAESYLERFVRSLDDLTNIKKSRPLENRYGVAVEKKSSFDIIRYNERIFGYFNEQEKRFEYPSNGVIFGRYRNKESCFALSEDDRCCLTNSIAISSKNLYGCSMRFLLALLNSQAIDFFIRFGKRKKKGAVQEYRRSTLKDVPIRILALQNPGEKETHDLIVGKAQELEQLQQEILQGDFPNIALQRRYKELKKELENVIFRLYNLESSSGRIRQLLDIST